MRAKDARSWGVHCVDDEAKPLLRPIIRGLRIIDSEAATAVAERRRELEREKQLWGGQVFRDLSPELFEKPERARALPEAGFFVLSLAPVLLVAANRERGRVLAYLEAQATLAERMLAQGEPSSPAHRQLRAFHDTNTRLRRALAAQE